MFNDRNSRYGSRSIRTDLALELQEDISQDENKDGFTFSEEIKDRAKLKKTIIQVTNPSGEQLLGKPIGTYITLESPNLCREDISIHQPFVDELYHTLYGLVGDVEKILVIGLGNRAVTPDSLGPLVVDHLFITRHLIKEGIVKKTKEIAALCPGVMAQTGIESSTIISALCKEIGPNVVIAIDALAAKDPARLNTTIQVSDTGITPGSGVGNRRMALNASTLGIPVIAVGVPTVISLESILYEALFKIYKEADVCDDKINNILEDNLMSMFVTPKNIDEIVNRVSYTISEAINRFLV